MERRSNIYDKFLIILIMSLATGYMGSIFTAPTHIIAFVFAPFALAKVFSMRTQIHTVLLWFVIVWSYGFLSIFWSRFFTHTLYGLLNLSIHFLICIEIVVFSRKAKNSLISVVNGWILAFVLTIPIALWELSTDNHIMTIAHEASRYRNNGSGVLLEKHVAAVTFYNPNTYCMFLVMVFPFLLYKFIKEKRFFLRLLCVAVILVLVYILFSNASRGSLLSIAIMFGIYIWITTIRGSTRGKRYTVLFLVLLAIIFYFFGDTLFMTIRYRMETKGLLEDNARLLLWQNTWQLVKDSYGFGTGLYTMVVVMEGFGNTNICYSHNLLLELMLEGGFVFLVPFILFLVQIYKSGRRTYDVGSKILLFGVLLAFPFYSVINSEYLRPTFIWVFFASLYPFISLHLYNDKTQKEL